MGRKIKVIGLGGRPKKEKPKVTLSQPAPVIRDIGAAPATLRSSGQAYTEFTRHADNAPIVVNRKATRVFSHPLDYYQHRGVIDNDQWSAGERLAKMHMVAFGSGYHAVNLDGFHGTTNYADNWRLGSSQGDALRDYIRTLKLFDAKQSVMLVDVCCRGEFAVSVSRKIGINPKTATEYLRACLNALSLFWRTGRKPNAPANNDGGAKF